MIQIFNSISPSNKWIDGKDGINNKDLHDNVEKSRRYTEQLQNTLMRLRITASPMTGKAPSELLMGRNLDLLRPNSMSKMW